MDQHEATIAFLKKQQACWEGLELQDLFKALHQSVFGCGHFVTENARDCLTQELAAQSPIEEDRGIELLDGPFCRFHLRHLAPSGISLETLYRVFALSAERVSCGTEELERKLRCLVEMTGDDSHVPWTAAEAEQAICSWRKAGFPACHHSKAVRERYHPAYRVLHQNYVWMLPLLAEIDRLLAQRGGGIVAIEGGSASGKTTLARQLAQIYDCAVYHMDDFFLRPEQRTEARLAQPGGNVDQERFLEEVLLPVTRGETVRLRRYDCGTQMIQPAVEQGPKALTIVEGAYSMHPDLAQHYALSAFLAVDPKVQHARIEVRNRPEQQVHFFNTWIPLEQRYFQAMNVQERCDLTLEVTACAW